ncbi:MAG: hypothetical protein IJW68_05280 [Bacteroidaceae bacterium]|nr:hypothetical protein [Bacteroidaceae bacterium]
MKKIVFVAVVALALCNGVKSLQTMNDNLLKDLTLTEIEALASSEKGCVSKTDKNNGDCTTDGVSYFCENSFAFHDCVKGEYF